MKKLISILTSLLICASLGYAQEIRGCHAFRNGVALIKLENKSLCFIDKTGKRIGEFYTSASEFSEGLAVFSTKDKLGFIDTTGNEVILLPKDTYGIARNFSNGLACVSLKNAKKPYGFIDKTGEEIIPAKFDKVSSFSDSVAWANIEVLTIGGSDGTRKRLVDPNGNTLMTKNYDAVKDFHEGRAWINDIKVKNRKRHYVDAIHYYKTSDSYAQWGLIDIKGKQIVKPQYADCLDFSEGLAAVKKDDKWGYIDTKGKEVLPLIYESVESFKNGLAKVYQGRWYSYIDKTGKPVITVEYLTDCESFADGMARIKKKFKYGFIDTTGNELIPPIYEEATDFNEGFAIAKIDGNWIVIDKQGNKVGVVDVK